MKEEDEAPGTDDRSQHRRTADPFVKPDARPRSRSSFATPAQSLPERGLDKVLQDFLAPLREAPRVFRFMGADEL